MNSKWNPSDFTILGILFSTSLYALYRQNYKQEYAEIKKLINS